MQPLTLITDGAFVAPGLALGAAYGRTLYRRGVRLSSRDLSQRARLLSCLGVGFILLNAAYLLVKNNRAVAWFLPVPVEYYGDTVTWFADLTVMAIFLGVAVAVAFLEGHQLRWTLPLAGAILLGSSVYVYHAFRSHVPPVLQAARVSKDGVILQTNGSTCAAAACANISTCLGVPKTEKEMVELLETRDDGTSNAEVIRGMRELGFKCVKRYVLDRDASRLHAPAMLAVDLFGQPDGHAVSYMGQTDGKAEIWDPTGGKCLLSAAELRARWRGRAIEVSR